MSDITIYVDGETGDTFTSTDAAGFVIDSIPDPAAPDDPEKRLPIPKQVLLISAPEGVDFQWATAMGSEALRSLAQRKPSQARAMYAQITLRQRAERAGGGALGGGGG